MNSKEAIKNVATIPNKIDNTGGVVYGNLNLTGNIQFNSKVALRTSGNSTIVSCNQGYMYLRPNGDASTIGQVVIDLAGNINTTSTINAQKFAGTLSGNASSASTLATSRLINGTSFNGSADITTANWGASRNITLGRTKKSVNGSADVSWSLDEIGAVDKYNDSTLAAGKKIGFTDGTKNYIGTTGADTNDLYLTSCSEIFISADNDCSSSAEYVSIKAGHNDLRVISSGGGTTVTQGANKLTFNGNQVFHSGVSEMKLTNNTTVGQSTKQEVSIVPGSIGMADWVEGTKRDSSIGTHNGGLEFYSSSMYFYPSSTSGVSFNGNVSITPEIKNGCLFTKDGMDSVMYGAFNMGQKMALGYIACMSVSQLSDKNTKEEIKYINNNEEKITSDDCYNFFLKDFKPVSFKYKNRLIDSPELGFIAQDVEETKLSEFLLIKKENQPLSFNNYSFTSALAIAFQKAVKELNSLKDEVKSLKDEIKQLKK